LPPLGSISESNSFTFASPQRCKKAAKPAHQAGRAR
jgi:hypothetical protein